VDSKRVKRKKLQQQEQSDETGDKTISDSAPKTLAEQKSTDAASSDIGVSSKENVPASVPVEVTIVDPTGNLSQSSAIPVSNHGILIPRYIWNASDLIKLF
jgi:hypothetical protein